MKPKILFWIDTNYTQFGISKFLQEKIDANFYVIYDFQHHIKKIFLDQSIVDFKKQWFYWDNHSRLDENFDLSYLKSFEIKYKIDLWKIISSERLFSDYESYHFFNNKEILSIVEKDCRFFETVLDEIKPDFLIIKLADFLRTHLLVELCKSKGIKVLMLIQNRLGYLVNVSSSITELQDFKKIQLDSKNNSPTFLELRNYLQKYDKQKQFQNLKSGDIGVSFTDKVKTFFEWFLNTFDDEYRQTYDHTGVTRFNVITKRIDNMLITRKRKSFIDNHSIMNINFGEKFIYFPLHIQPERNLDLDAPYFKNQLDVIENIARSLPINYKLYVKEHFSMKYRKWRPLSFYKTLLSLPNVRFLHPSFDSLTAIKNSSLVITIAGSSGLEAAFYEKPSIIFADVSYSNLSCVTKVENIEDLHKLIKNSLKIQVDPFELFQFIKFQENNSIPFDEIELNNSILDNFHSSGLVPDSKISIKNLNSFFENRRKSFEPLINEYIKKIFNQND